MGLFVSNSRLHGVGVFTDTFIRRGTEIPDIKSRYRDVCGGYNWSQNPNTKILYHPSKRFHYMHVALRDIQAGEELTVPYYDKNSGDG